MSDKATLIAFGLLIFLVLSISLAVMPMLLVVVLGWFGVTISFWQGLVIWIVLGAIGGLFR